MLAVNPTVMVTIYLEYKVRMICPHPGHFAIITYDRLHYFMWIKTIYSLVRRLASNKHEWRSRKWKWLAYWFSPTTQIIPERHILLRIRMQPRKHRPLSFPMAAAYCYITLARGLIETIVFWPAVPVTVQETQHRRFVNIYYLISLSNVDVTS